MLSDAKLHPIDFRFSKKVFGYLREVKIQKPFVSLKAIRSYEIL